MSSSTRYVLINYGFACLYDVYLYLNLCTFGGYQPNESRRKRMRRKIKKEENNLELYATISVRVMKCRN